MTSIICIFSIFFCSFNPFLWQSQTKVRSYCFRNDFLILSIIISFKANVFLRLLKIYGLKNVDWFLNFASLVLLFINLIPCLIKNNSHLLCSKKKNCIAKVLSDCFLTLSLAAFKFRYWVFAVKFLFLLIFLFVFFLVFFLMAAFVSAVMTGSRSLLQESNQS